MTKTLSKSKSNCGSKHGEQEEGYSCDKRKFRTYFGKAKETVLGNYAINECGIYVTDREHVRRGVNSVGAKAVGVVHENRRRQSQKKSCHVKEHCKI